MEKTTFAGLTALDPNESVYSDNSAFVDRDRFEIDRELKIGVKTHRHDGKSGLSSPTIAPSGIVVGSGGSIPAGLSLTLGITYQDASGGETLVGPTTLVTTPTAVQSPTTQLEASVDYAAGSLDVDTFTYAFTYVDSGGGETPLSPGTVVTRSPGFENAEIKLVGETEWPDPGIVGVRIYRARAGGEYVFLAELEAPGEFLDDGSISPDCDRHPPSFNVNTTGGANQIEVILPDEELPDPSTSVERSAIRLYCSQSGNFDESCLVGSYPTGSAGANVFIDSLSLLDAQPPDVNRSFGGADQIDPDTELLDWHWKRPVATKAALPVEAEEGDARVVLEDGSIWVFTTEWKQVSGAGGGEVETPHYTDEFPEGSLDAGWTFVKGSSGSDWPVPLTEDLEAKDGLVAPTEEEGGAIVRSDMEMASGVVEIDYKIHPSGVYVYEVGPIAKWIDKDNFIAVVREEESTGRIWLLGRWHGLQVINILQRKSEHPTVPAVPAEDAVVTMRISFEPEFLLFEWLDATKTVLYSLEYTLQQLKELSGEPEEEEMIESLMAAVGKPGLILKPEGAETAVEITRFKAEEESQEPSLTITDGSANVHDVERIHFTAGSGVAVSVSKEGTGSALVEIVGEEPTPSLSIQGVGSASFVDEFGGASLDWRNYYGTVGEFLKVESGLMLPVKTITGIGQGIVPGAASGFAACTDGVVTFKFKTGASADSSTHFIAGVSFRRLEFLGTKRQIAANLLTERFSGFIAPGEEITAVAPSVKTNTWYSMRVSFFGNDLKMQVWEGEPESGEAHFEVSGTLQDEGVIEDVGAGVAGIVKWEIPPVATDWRWDDFVLEAFDSVGGVNFVAGSGVTLDITREFGDVARVEVGIDRSDGMGVIVIPTSEKGIARPTKYGHYTWYCKEEPTNLGEYDIWIEEGP